MLSNMQLIVAVNNLTQSSMISNILNGCEVDIYSFITKQH